MCEEPSDLLTVTVRRSLGNLITEAELVRMCSDVQVLYKPNY